MEAILKYIKEKYKPLAIIVYGSYADGSNGVNSDFDALVICESGPKCHDVSVAAGVQLDVFVYPRAYFEGDYDPDEIAQIFDGIIVMDTESIGAGLKRRAAEYWHTQPARAAQDIASDIAWCRKMLYRTRRKDAEGLFRWHWVLTDSLRIFCDAMGQPYFGPKKSLRWMEKYHPQAYVRYHDALLSMEESVLERWIVCLEETL